MRTVKKRNLDLLSKHILQNYKTTSIMRSNTASGFRDVYTDDPILRFDDRTNIVRGNLNIYNVMYS